MRINPGDWSGDTAVIVATGPSVSLADVRAVALAHRRGAKVVTVNDAAYPCWFADIAYSSDVNWWQHHDNLRGFPGWACGLRYREGSAMIAPPNLATVEASGRDGFDPDPRFIRHGGNSGYAAIHLVAHLGAAKIVLVGLDHTAGHWFGDHPEGLQRPPTGYGKMIPRYAVLAAALAERGVKVINTSAHSAIPYFRKAPLIAALEESCAQAA
jgi:hypothetical protein